MTETEKKQLKVEQKDSIILLSEMLLDFVSLDKVEGIEFDNMLSKLQITAESLNTMIHTYFEE